MKKHIQLIIALTLSNSVWAAGIDCATLPEWSDPIDGYQVNQTHIFCGEKGNNGKAKGFHATPGGENPTDYVSAVAADTPNAAGIYTLKTIKLKIDGHDYVKSFSSMYPEHCSQAQINQSIVYSLTHKTGLCADPSWASCGPNAPAEGGAQYCVGSNNTGFTIATALLNGTSKINTGFPIYTK